jgi:signal transduction histidine kinase
MASDLERQLADLKSGDHICPVCDDIAEQIVAAACFVKHGLSRGERCLYAAAADATAERTLQACASEGIDVTRERERGALRLLSNREVYLPDGEFVPERTIEFWARAEAEAIASGFSGLSFIGDMNWALGPEPGCERLIEYEAMLNRFVENSRCVILCRYHRPLFSPSVIHDVIRTHPTVIFSDIVYPNPYYEPPELLLSPTPRASAEFKSKRVEWWLARLEQARQAAREREQLLERLHVLSMRLIDSLEAERRHLARELHDEMGQILTGLRTLLKPSSGIDADALNAKLEKAREGVEELLEIGRRLAFDLRPAVLDMLGLLPALLTFFERYTAQTGIHVDFKHEDLQRRFTPHVETTAYRIVQEALTNVARHAETDNVTVRIWASPQKLCIRVADRGRGFDPQIVATANSSNGLLGMQERALLLHGQLNIESHPGAGAEITAELPLSEPAAKKGES